MGKRKVTDFFTKKGQGNISEPTQKKTNAENVSNLTEHTQQKDAAASTSEARKQGNSTPAADEAFHPPKHFSFPKTKFGVENDLASTVGLKLMNGFTMMKCKYNLDLYYLKESFLSRN